MTEQTPIPPAVDTRHWRASRRSALRLGAAWLIVSFGPLLLSPWLDWQILGAPVVFWICAQVVPVLFVVLVWRYERIADRLDRERRQGRTEG